MRTSLNLDKQETNAKGVGSFGADLLFLNGREMQNAYT